MHDKQSLIDTLITQLKHSLNIAIESAKHAHQDATHEQSKAETQYDSLGIEMAYLAEGQSKRIDALRHEIQLLSEFNWPKENHFVQLGHLVKLQSLCSSNVGLVVFILPVAGGNQLIEANDKIQVVTPNAPLANALLKQELNAIVTLPWLGEEFEITQLI